MPPRKRTRASHRRLPRHSTAPSRGKPERVPGAQPSPLAPVWVAASCAIALCSLHLWSTAGSPPRTVLLTNAARYDTWARLIGQGNPPLPPFEQPPLYAYLVAATYWLAGASPQFFLALQAGLDGLLCGLIAWAAGRSFGAGAAWVAGLMAASFGPLIYHAAELLPATLGTTLLVAGAAGALSGSSVIAALAFGVAVLLRPESLLAVVLVAAVAAAHGQRRLATWVAGTAVGALAVGSLAVSLLAGRPLPYSTGLGLNLWLGNNPAADGVSPFVPRTQEGLVDRVRFEAGGDALLVDRRLAEQACRFWRDFPGPALRLAAKKLRWTFVDRELPNTTALDWQLSYSLLFATPFFPFSFGVVWVLAWVGAVLLGRRSLAPWPFWALALATVVVCTTFFTNGRFRLPIAPLLLLLAGGGASQLWALARRGRRGRLPLPRVLLAASAGLGAAYLAFSDPYRVRDYRIAELDTNAGMAERVAGHPERARHYLRQALRQDPRDEIAWVHLVLAQEELGQARDALASLLEAGERLETAPDLERLAANFFARHGLPIELWRDFRTSAEAGRRDALRRELQGRLAAGSTLTSPGSEAQRESR